ncbi:DUF420 domain-containing protein [Bacteriovorax sp. Seq25_V]|uniref:DUF420 domain-containing protein n=1 Tax=Bacteriovorax sp. Seq25_V TaxID=1201288 RepID=UPI00038A28A2|nr:DUF420 domain-containing protein [Bacteriovorax sp. Seq25_V]EQC43220.1 PF04238 family protein [Bacteriovorax sp. Seq25_V]
MKKNNKNYINTIIYALSFAIVVFLVWYIYIKPEATTVYDWVANLPYVNASLNSLAAIFLVFGFVAIKNGNVKYHIRFMSLATVSSTLFLVSYLLYHHFHGDTKFIADGLIRPIYFFILVSHILLSVALVPMALMTIFNAITMNFVTHKRWAKWTFPVWLYVSVTGVVIVFILKLFNHA